MNKSNKQLLGIIAEQLARIIELEEYLANADTEFRLLTDSKEIKRVKK